MDYKFILDLMKEMNQTDLTKLEIENGDFKLTLEKSRPASNVEQPMYTQQASAQSCIQTGSTHPQLNLGQSVATVTASISTETKEKPEDDDNCKKIVSPMVGTFYAAPAPDKPPFVKVGDKVKKGQTICIIEAMKLMNEIESDYDGEIAKVLVNNEDMVQFGQPLFIIKQC